VLELSDNSKDPKGIVTYPPSPAASYVTVQTVVVDGGVTPTPSREKSYKLSRIYLLCTMNGRWTGA
jgi:hypothetical protein